jgi:hypothetical protein
MLKPDTEAVWQFLRRQPSLTGFVLMGGSALALRLGHRQSEDLDTATEAPTSGPRLASLPELFRSKALLSARRSRTRDACSAILPTTRKSKLP